jgi:hypothetical protein
MSEQDGGTEKTGLVIVALVVLLVVFGVLGLGISKSRPRTAAPPPLSQFEAPSPVEQLRFTPGQDKLPLDSQDALGRIADKARGSAGAVVVISGTFAAGGDEAASRDLAQRRVQQVRHALEANGVPPQQLVTAAPSALPPGRDAAAADSVQMMLQ